MYESPVTLIEQMASDSFVQTEDYILQQIMPIVQVDKGELLKALQYDRDQYSKGYADGKADAINHSRWIDYYVGVDHGCDVYAFMCSNCSAVKSTESLFCPHCGAKMDDIVLD